MTYVIAALATLVRLFRPSRGIHAAPLAVRRDVREEARATRVRRYANPLPARPSGPGYSPLLPLVPPVAPVTALLPTVVIRRYHVSQEAARTAVITGKVAA